MKHYLLFDTLVMLSAASCVSFYFNSISLGIAVGLAMIYFNDKDY